MNHDDQGPRGGNGSPTCETKFCPHCQKQRSVDDFARQRKGGTGRQSWCRDCINATRREAYARSKGTHHGNA